MLTGLSIRDFVLVRTLDLETGEGFTALTGETGAGKSILLSALSLALGGRARADQVRSGAEAASISAEFEVAGDHPLRRLLSDKGMEIGAEDAIVFRRVIRRAGPARAFLNDQPVSAALLAEAGAMVADIHGQHEGHGLMEAARHRTLLDAHAGAAPQLAVVAQAWTRWRCAREARLALEQRLARAAAERTWLTHAVDELDALDPEEGAAQRLASERATMQAGERVSEAIDGAEELLRKAHAEQAIANAGRTIARALSLPQLTGDASESELAQRMRAASEALERALIEAGEARSALARAASACEFSPAALEACEARLFALRAAARKHDVDVEQLPGLLARLKLQLAEIEQSDASLGAAREAEAAGEAAYAAAAAKLTALRETAAKKLTRAVMNELPPLKLDKARFRASVTQKPAEQAGPSGLDDVAFEIATQPGADFAPLGKIASGGEMARLSLAISLCLADATSCTTLVFDEADVGVGGAVAAAIGERLGRLSRSRQVLAITHSPQVAAAARRQLRISKESDEQGMSATVSELKPRARKEEIARMLSGATVTREARAAAGRLLAGT